MAANILFFVTTRAVTVSDLLYKIMLSKRIHNNKRKFEEKKGYLLYSHIQMYWTTNKEVVHFLLYSLLQYKRAALRDPLLTLVQRLARLISFTVMHLCWMCKWSWSYHVLLHRVPLMCWASLKRKRTLCTSWLVPSCTMATWNSRRSSERSRRRLMALKVREALVVTLAQNQQREVLAWVDSITTLSFPLQMLTK